MDFLGDVQIVADFQGYRQRILDEFDAVMTQAAALGPGDVPAELYVVAHSEGTVVAFLALLNALADPEAHPWIAAVRGVMTIGSPIEIHHLLWPELWQQAGPDNEGLRPHPRAPRDIPWQNYYDRGDPIVYELTDTSQWLRDQGFLAHLHLEQFSFSRSLLPGKAHTDLLGMTMTCSATSSRPWSSCRRSGSGRSGSFARPPGDKLSAIVGSYAIPQALILAVLLAATYCLYRPVADVLHPEGLPSWTVVRDVTGIGLLLLGVTAAGRLPRLTQERRWWFISAALLVLSMVTYSSVTCASSRWALGRAFADSRMLDDLSRGGWASGVPVLEPCSTDGASVEAAVAQAVKAGAASPEQVRRQRQADVAPATAGVLVVAGVLALMAGILASWSPRWGVRFCRCSARPARPRSCSTSCGPVPRRSAFWPIVIGAGLFFYLWWLATLLFDLVFVWQRYMRHSAALTHVSTLSREGYKSTRLERAIDRRAGHGR